MSNVNADKSRRKCWASSYPRLQLAVSSLWPQHWTSLPCSNGLTSARTRRTSCQDGGRPWNRHLTGMSMRPPPSHNMVPHRTVACCLQPSIWRSTGTVRTHGPRKLTGVVCASPLITLSRYAALHCHARHILRPCPAAGCAQRCVYASTLALLL